MYWRFQISTIRYAILSGYNNKLTKGKTFLSIEKTVEFKKKWYVGTYLNEISKLINRVSDYFCNKLNLVCTWKTFDHANVE